MKHIYYEVFMPSLKQIKTRIKSTQNLKQITKALEVVSTVKLQKNKNKTEHMRDYFIQLAQIISKVGTYTGLFDETINTGATRELVILISSDKGLCGTSNSKLFKNINEAYQDKKETTDFFVVGKKGLEFTAKSGYNVVGSLHLGDEFTQQDLSALFAYLQNHTDDYTNIVLVFNFFKNVLVQLPQTLSLFPFRIDQIGELFKELGVPLYTDMQIDSDTLLEPNTTIINAELLRQIKQYVIIAALLQNKLTEHANRMVAMKSAKDNCNKLIKNLTLQKNKARQAAITKEISEIVSAKIAIEG